MRYVGPVQGAAAARVSSDEVLPSKGVLQRDLISFLTNRYQFNMSPPTGPGVGSSPILTFGSGIFDSEGDRIPIIQTSIFPDGFAVFARGTNYAEAVLESLMLDFDNELGYHYLTVPVERLYLSQIAVEFDESFLQQTEVFKLAQDLINDALHRDTADYRLKRLTFGCDTNPESALMVQSAGVEQVMLRDFIIERRAGSPIEKNLFFCSAPMKTEDHIVVLEKIANACLHRV